VVVRQRAWKCTGRDQTREVRHVDHEVGADTVGDGAEMGEVDGAAVRRTAGYDDLGPVFHSELLKPVIVDDLVLPAHRVGDRPEPHARLVDRLAVREVAAGVEIHAHEGVARLHQRHEHRLVGLRARVRLHVCPSAIEQRLGPLDRQDLDLVDIFAAAIVAATRIAFGVFIGEY
jgi:hypothetical protein